MGDDMERFSAELHAKLDAFLTGNGFLVERADGSRERIDPTTVRFGADGYHVDGLQGQYKVIPVPCPVDTDPNDDDDEATAQQKREMRLYQRLGRFPCVVIPIIHEDEQEGDQDG